MARECVNGFVSGREEDPVLQIQPAPRVEHGIDCSSIVAQVMNSDDARGVSRKGCDRRFVVEDADGYAASPEASRHPQARMLTTNNDGSDFRSVHRQMPSGRYDRCRRHDVSSREANSVPATKYNSGPKLLAAGA